MEKLHNKDLNELYSSPNIVQVIKSRMRLVGHIAHMGERRDNTGFGWENLSEIDHLEDPGVDGMIVLRWIFRKWDVGARTGLSWLRTGTGGGHV